MKRVVIVIHCKQTCLLRVKTRSIIIKFMFLKYLLLAKRFQNIFSFFGWLQHRMKLVAVKLLALLTSLKRYRYLWQNTTTAIIQKKTL